MNEDLVIDSKQNIMQGWINGTVITIEVVSSAACEVLFEVTNDKTDTAVWSTYATSTLTAAGSDTSVSTSSWQRMRATVVSGSPSFIGVCSR
jgi:hypothetical protein